MNSLIVEGKWDLSAIEGAAIKAIPLSSSGMCYVLRWPFSKNGVYEVKSGYHCFKKMLQEVPCGPSCSSSTPHELWKCVGIRTN